jgi:hypothetical protein
MKSSLGYLRTLLLLSVTLRSINAFSRGPLLVAPSGRPFGHSVWFSSDRVSDNYYSAHVLTSLRAKKVQVLDRDNDVCTIQILMSDTGGGHRASANALQDAFDVLYPGKIQCDIVDVYTDYGKFSFPFSSMFRGFAETISPPNC